MADALNWALTGFEVWRYALVTKPTSDSPGKTRLQETLKILKVLVEDGVLTEKDGHYVFFGREDLVDERLLGTRFLYGKRKKAVRWAKKMIRVPFVLGVFAYGSLASGHTKEESDLDVYVVMQNGRIFTGRVLVSLFLEIFGVRRTATKIRDQVCLNHFAIRDAISFQEQYRSPFSAWLWARMFPLALKDASLQGDFYDANQWVSGYFPNLYVMKHEAHNTQQQKSSTPHGLGFMNVVEKFLGKMQLARIERHPLTKKGEGRIVANGREMIFHPGLPEEKVMRAFHRRLQELSL